jgi:hypothetical protein
MSKFKINDLVELTPEYLVKTGFKRNPQLQIEDIFINQTENLRIEDGEIVWSVDHVNYKGNMKMSYDVKESNLQLRTLK